MKRNRSPIGGSQGVRYGCRIRLISFKQRRFQPDTILLAVRLFYRFTLSLRDVDELMAERGSTLLTKRAIVSLGVV